MKPTPYHRRPKCTVCHRRAAGQDLDGAYSLPCVTCTVERAMRDANVRVWREGDKVLASADGFPAAVVAYVSRIN